MFKTNEEIIIIQAKATTPIPTGVVFWSHDKGTAKMLFQLQKDYVNQTLSEGTIVPICLDFVGGRHIYHAVIEDAINGIVSIVLEDNILGYVGRVTGSIYIELPDSRSLDTAGRFTFDIKRSPIDLNTPELDDYYWQGFNEIMNQYHQTIAEIETESERLLNELQARILTLEEKLDDVELRARFKTAWSWSADGTDRFTKVYPGENLYDTSLSLDNSAATVFEGLAAGTSTIEKANGVMHVVLDDNVSQAGYSVHYKGTELKKNTKYFFGIDAKGTGNIRINYRIQNAAGEWAVGWTGIVSMSALTADYSRYSGSFVTPDWDMQDIHITFYLNGAGTEAWQTKPKLEIGSVGTPYTPAPSEDPINAYPTYKGISIVDSDNPADYSWQAEDNTIAKKATLDSHTENISNPHKVTKTQVGLGNVDNYSTATQAEAESGTATEKLMTPLRTKQHVDKRIATKAEAEAGTSETAIMSPLRTKEVVDTNQPFGVSISGGLMEGVNRVDATTLTIGTIISYDNTHSKTNDLFNISSDQKTMTILRDCTLYFTGMFVSQTSSGSYYSVMRQFINGVNDLRLCGISGTVNWRNDCGFSVTRSFLQGDKITFVLGTNYTNASAEAFGISQLHIQEVLPV